MFSLFKFLLLTAGPIVGYFFFGKTQNSALVGLGISSLFVVIWLFFEVTPLDSLVFGVIGGIAGVAFSLVLNWLTLKLNNPSFESFMSQYSLMITIFSAIAGLMIAIKKKGELDLLDRDIITPGNKNSDMKILDTSVLIDGRIIDIAETGFLSGKILVPRFVLHELQMVADSADATKRQRGRRGLDILKRLQDSPHINVKIYDKDYSNINEVDTKIIELARELGAKVATNDFNLNKVAALQGISVLNINDLAAALKAVVLPGDNLLVFLAKEGKERAQAVGYLDDGTMVVVEDGRGHIGKRVNAHVNSILQTSAGRMIFAKAIESKDHGNGRAALEYPDPNAAGG